MRLVRVVCLLAPMSNLVADLSMESGSVQVEKSGVESVRRIEAGERVILPSVIRSGSGQAVLRLGEAAFVALEPGAVLEAHGLDDTLHLTPQAGMIVVHARRTGVDSPGVQIEYRGSRLRVHDGTLGLMIGDDAILIRMLLRGQGFEMSPDEVYLTEVGAPSMFMISEAAALEIVELRDLIRPDQVKLNSVAVGCATLLADRLEARQDGLRSNDLGAVLESMRVVHFRMNREESSRVLTVLVNAARREWSVRAGQEVELPELIRIPEAVAPWDRAIRTWTR
jgi:hypothetical protein